MSNAGVSLIMQQSAVSQEAVKALSVPVPGAVVIAPLTQSLRNYGSIGGELTKVGSASLTPEGLSCAQGTGSGARIVTGWSSDFTLIVRARLLQSVSTENVMFSTMQPSTGFAGWALSATITAYFGLGIPAVGTYASTVAKDLNWHTFTLLRSGTTTSLYIDGALSVSKTTGIANGTQLVLCGMIGGGAFGYGTNGIFRNPTQYHSALSDTDRALVEAWASA